MNPNSKASKRTARTALFATLLLLGACGGTPDASDAETQSGKTTEPTESAESAEESAEPTDPLLEGFPVGAPFGKAAWGIEAGGETRVNVRADRVIVDTTDLTSRTIRAYTEEGGDAWEREVSGDFDNTPVRVLDKTVAILGEVEVEGSGLDKDRTDEQLTLLSQEDGSVIAEESGARVDDQGVIVLEGGTNALTEEGKVVPYEPVETPAITADSVAGIPLDPSIKTDGFISADILAIHRQLGISILFVTQGTPDVEFLFYGVDNESGKVAYELECPGYTATDGENNVAESSPNGKYGVHESIWMSATESKCFGGEDGQEQVEFTAVDDAGTAYGITREGMTREGMRVEQLVVIPNGADAELFDAPAPVGIMNGSIAVHIDGRATKGNLNETIYRNATMITGNPIE